MSEEDNETTPADSEEPLMEFFDVTQVPTPTTEIAYDMPVAVPVEAEPAPVEPTSAPEEGVIASAPEQASVPKRGPYKKASKTDKEVLTTWEQSTQFESARLARVNLQFAQLCRMCRHRADLHGETRKLKAFPCNAYNCDCQGYIETISPASGRATSSSFSG